MSHHTFRQGDTAGFVSISIASGLGADIDDAACSFSARDQDREIVVSGAAGTISGVVTAGDDTKGATFSVDLPAELAAEPGFNWGHFKVTYEDGSIQTVPANDLLTIEITPNFALLGEESEAAEVVSGSYLQLQDAHGFDVLDLVRIDAGVWSKAQADDPDTLAQAIVISVPSVNSFRMLYLSNREATFPEHGFDGLLYLSAATAGALTETEPLAGVVQIVAVVKDEDTLILQNVAPEVIP